MRIVIVVAVVLCLGLLGYGAWCSAESMKGVDRINETIQKQDNAKAKGVVMQTKRTFWKSKKHNGVDLPGPIDIEILTPRNAGETEEAWQTRHDQSVTRALTTNPPMA